MILRTDFAALGTMVADWKRSAIAYASWRFAGLAALGVGFIAAVVAKGDSDEIALVAAVANGVIAIAAVMSFRATVRQGRETLHLSTLHYLDEQWLRLRETREASARALIEERPDDRNLDYLLDFFETVAACVEDGRVSDEQAADAFGWYAGNYWHATALYRQWVGERIGSTIWDCFDRVAGRWAGGRGSRPPESELGRFLRDESDPARDQGEFRAWLKQAASDGST